MKRRIAAIVVLLIFASIGAMLVYQPTPPSTPSKPPEKPSEIPVPSKPLEISGPWMAEVGEEVAFKVTSEDRPVQEVVVTPTGCAEKSTDLNGIVSLRFEKVGAYRVVASKKGYDHAYTLIEIYPKGNDAIQIRGIRWPYPPFSCERLHSIRMMGANYLALKVWYLIDNRGKISPAIHSEDNIVLGVTWENFEAYAQCTISEAKSYGFKILLVPFLWEEGRRLDEPVEPQTFIKGSLEMFEEEITNITLKTANLAEKYGVEMLIPLSDLYSYTSWNFASLWHQKMLPKLREVYKGKLVVGSQKYHLGVVDYPYFDYSGYDYVGLGMDFDGFPASWEKLRLAIRRVLDYADGLKTQYGTRIIVSRVAFQPLQESMAIFEGYDEHPEDVKVRCYETMFEEATGRVDGFFFYMWEYSVPTFLCLKRAGKEFIPVSAYQGKGAYNIIRDHYSKPCEKLGIHVAKNLNVTIDGDDSDWIPINPLCVDPINDTWLSGRDLRAIYAFSDNEDLYIMVEAYSKIDYDVFVFLVTELLPIRLGYLVTLSPTAQQTPLWKLNWSADPPHSYAGIIEDVSVGNNIAEVKVPLEKVCSGLKEIEITVYANVPSLTPSEIPGFPFTSQKDVDACGDEAMELLSYAGYQQALGQAVGKVEATRKPWCTLALLAETSSGLRIEYSGKNIASAKREKMRECRLL